jgi:hypothetical protein
MSETVVSIVVSVVGLSGCKSTMYVLYLKKLFLEICMSCLWEKKLHWNTITAGPTAQIFPEEPNSYIPLNLAHLFLSDDYMW